MQFLSIWKIVEIVMRMPPSKWMKFTNIGIYTIDEYFFKKYFRINGILKTVQPDYPQLVGWENRKQQDIDLSEVPWANDSTSPQWISGDDNNGYTIYYSDEFTNSNEMIEGELRDFTRDVIRQDQSQMHLSANGYYMVWLIKQQSTGENEIVMFIKYCPYDAIILGFYIPKYDIWEFMYSANYYGQTKNGLRSGKGVLKFYNDFELYIDNWPDAKLFKLARDQTSPPNPDYLKDFILSILNKYLRWGIQTHYF